MIGAIIGDIVGSMYEFTPTKDYNFELFPIGSTYTDDSIMCCAIADAILNKLSYSECLRNWGRKYPNPKGGYGNSFRSWLENDNPQPYNSYGNGSAMRVAPIGWAFDSLEQTQLEAYKSAECTHSHPEGIKGAVAVVTAIWLARNKKSREYIKHAIEQQFSYDLSFSLLERKRTMCFDESCMGTVPIAIKCYLESHSFEDAVRMAVAMGGDADTLSCITGAIAEAEYRVISTENQHLYTFAVAKLPTDMLHVWATFLQRYVKAYIVDRT